MCLWLITILTGGQNAEKGLPLNPPSLIQRIEEQIPHPLQDSNLAAVHFLYKSQQNAQSFKVASNRLCEAIHWVKYNNHLYNDNDIGNYEKIISQLRDAKADNTISMDEVESSASATVIPLNPTVNQHLLLKQTLQQLESEHSQVNEENLQENH